MKKQQKTGRVNVYVIYSEGFFDRLRPSYDSAANAIGELTLKEVNTLQSLIDRYIGRCHKRHGKLLLEAAINRGQYS